MLHHNVPEYGLRFLVNSSLHLDLFYNLSQLFEDIVLKKK